MNEEVHPLHWPVGVPRTERGKRERARFSRKADRTFGEQRFTVKDSLTTAMSLDRLRKELGRFNDAWNTRVNVDHVVISSNLAPGLSISKQKEPEDPGVAVYFTLDGERRCIPSDKWDRVADNIAGIAAAIGALRGLERWVNDANVRAAFKGFLALPDPDRIDWRAVFGVKPGEKVAPGAIKLAHRRLAIERHPDHGGSDSAMAELNKARDQALAEVGR